MPVMRAWVVLGCLLPACGRFGFDTGSIDARDPAFRRTLLIDHTKVAGDLTDFPVLVRAPAGVQPLAFTDDRDNELAFEVEAHTGSIASAWVKLPQLSATTDTKLYLYYDNGTGTPPDRTPEVWSNGFVGVYHFGDGTTLDPTDTTGHSDGTVHGATPGPGPINGAAVFDSNADILVPNAGVDTTPGAVHTVTFWLDYQLPFNTMPVAFYESSSGLGYGLWFASDGCEGFNTGVGDNLTTSATGLAGRWIHVAAVFYNGVPTAASNKLFFDGVEQTLTRDCTPTAPDIGTVQRTLYWGGLVGFENYRLIGSLDEGRLAIGARSTAWIQTEHANQSDPDAFIATGPEEVR
jgi:hypothetical protein